MYIIRRLANNDIQDCLHIVRFNWDRDAAQKCAVELTQAFANAVWRPIFYVAELDGQIVGLAGYIASWLNYGVYEITRLDIDPAHQRKGIGRKLMTRCLDDIEAVGKIVMLSTTIPEYYKHWGFETCVKHGDDSIMMLDIT